MKAIRIDYAALLTLTLVSRIAVAATWTGSAGTDWFNTNNWDTSAVPGVGATVTVPAGSTLLLTNETAELAAFTMAGGTLTFSNWTTRLRAAEVAIDGGTLTLPPAFSEAQMSNRVWIVCSNFTLAAGAKINVNGLGYACTNGVGRGLFSRAGGGHGGYGSPGGGDHPHYTRLAYRGVPYGSTQAPVTPGSGAGHATAGGAGGGAVLIQASGHAAINGEVLANGQSGTAYDGGGGSGGSIYITCRTVAGETGLLSAQGGSNYSTHKAPGPGSGGRIALVYDVSAQPASPIPSLRFTAHPGNGYRDYLAEYGTVHFPDNRFLSNMLSAAQWDGVRFVIPGMQEWAPASLIVSGRVAFASLRVINVGGSLTLATGSRLILHGSPTNTSYADCGMVLKVGGVLTIDDGAVLELMSNHTNGLSPYVECGSLNLRTGGSILAEKRGYDPATGSGAGGFRGGGGYGGTGSPGRLNVGFTGGAEYGKRHAPVEPGSGSGGANLIGARGGGLVRVSARHSMRVDGTIGADGMRRLENGYGGASGGGIMLTAGSFKGTGTLSAKGGDAHNTAGAGGGGRIAVWTPFMPYATVQAMAAEDALPTGASEVQPADWPGWSGSILVDSGTGGENPDLAQDGTLFFGRFVLGTTVLVR
jgi:hypothetical protein